jgi:hypothetical protein
VNTSPIDTYEGAAEIFTFGADSFGTWLFIVLAALLLVGMIVRTMLHETRSYAEIREGNIVAPIATEPEVPTSLE